MPRLLALLLGPGVGALVNGDDELRDGAQDLEELGSVAFIGWLLGLKNQALHFDRDASFRCSQKG